MIVEPVAGTSAALERICARCKKPFQSWRSFPVPYCSKACADGLDLSRPLRPNPPPAAAPRPVVRRAVPRTRSITPVRPSKKPRPSSRASSRPSNTTTRMLPPAPPSRPDAQLVILDQHALDDLRTTVRGIHEQWPEHLIE